MNFLVTGCGRSGTMYLSSVLNATGVPCGHEVAFTVFGPKDVAPKQNEASWYAVPFLARLSPTVKIVHLVRNPIDVVASFHRIGVCASSPWHHLTAGRDLPGSLFRMAVRPVFYLQRLGYVAAHRDLLRAHTRCIEPLDELDRLWRYWDEWNGLLEDFASSAPNPYFRIRLEDLDARLPELAGFLDLARPLSPQPPANVKSNYRSRPIVWTPVPETVRRRARRYGYSEADLSTIER